LLISHLVFLSCRHFGALHIDSEEKQREKRKREKKKRFFFFSPCRLLFFSSFAVIFFGGNSKNSKFLFLFFSFFFLYLGKRIFENHQQSRRCALSLGASRSAIPGRTYSPLPEDVSVVARPRRRNGGRLHSRHSRVPCRRGARAGRKRRQGAQGEAHYAAPPAARHPRRRRARLAHQGYHCGWRCYPAHPQIPDQKVRGSNLQRVNQLEKNQFFFELFSRSILVVNLNWC
jgi:hypothetical protein